MITEQVEQGSEKWKAFRLGIPTASNFDKIITPKGEPSKQAEKYMYTLAVERVTGKKEETFQSSAMTRGIEMEAEARDFYELINSVKVESCGIGFADEKRNYAASPDGLVGEDGQIEIKNPIASTMCAYLLGKSVEEYYPQVQGQLLVTGRKWADLVIYFPGLRPLIVRWDRDEIFISKLKVELEKFCILLEKTVEQIR